jgi:hemoglobin-like flavoprotein
MEADRARAIASSLEIAAERGGDLGPRVYGLLFERAPEVHALFWRDSHDQIKGEMLMRVFEAILDFIGERRYADHLIQSEVLAHEDYDVPRDVFATFFGIVAEVVKDACGTAWGDQMEFAWQRLLADLDYYVRHPEQIKV